MTSLSPPSFSSLNSPLLFRSLLSLLFFSFFFVIIVIIIIILFALSLSLCTRCMRVYVRAYVRVCVRACVALRAALEPIAFYVYDPQYFSPLLSRSSFRDYLRNAQPSILTLTNFLALAEPRRKGHGSKE